jgi:hypothetical protein
MQINVAFDLSLLDKTRQRYEKNLAYSVAQALNDTALDAQKRIRESMAAKFHLRKQDFMFRAIKMFAFAKVGADRPYAELGIDNKPRLLLALFQSGGERKPFKGQSVAVPITGNAARPGISDSVTPAFTFQALGFVRGPVTQAGKEVLAARRAKHIRKRKLGGQYYVWQGAQRTFILPHSRSAPYGGVFQRIGPKKDDLRLIYSFRKNVQVRKMLDFVENSRASYDAVFQDAFVKRFFRL